MNKRTLNKVVNFNKDGLSFQMCLSILIQMSSGPNEAAEYIEKFLFIRAPMVWEALIPSKIDVGNADDALTLDDICRCGRIDGSHHSDCPAYKLRK